MKRIFTSLFLLSLFSSIFCNAQSSEKKQQIAKAVTDYFHLERENIHAHLNKNVFLTSESVWFKGYVYHRKAGIPFFATTNIYASLIDGQGNILNTQLLYGSIGSFSGSFKLDGTFKSGKYYLQFYTNWMNNFTEDESSIYEISVINPETGAEGIPGKPDLSRINIAFHPEGGNIIKDINNIIGITVSDCLNDPIAVSSIDIVNASGAVVKTVQINKMGYGRFDLPADSGQGLKAVVKAGGKVHEQPLPAPQLKGIALEINNYSFPDKLIAKIKTNALTAGTYKGKSFFMLVQQDEKYLIHELGFTTDKPEQMVVIPQKDLSEGTNTIRILDSDLNQIAERLVFKYPSSGLVTELRQIKKDSEYTELTGKINQPAMNMSISILPDATAALASNNDIYGSLLISPYVESQKKFSGRYFFESLSKVKHYELDLLMLNQISKYKWWNILKNPPKNTYTFDMGVTLKATLNNKLGNNKNYKVRAVSTAGMFDEQLDINEKGEILLENMVLADSSNVRFSLLENGVKKQELKLYPQVFNNKRKFNKIYKPMAKECPLSINDTLNTAFVDMLPKFNTNTIILDAVEVKADKKELKYRKAPGNSQLRPYKVTETDSHSFFYILDFIRYHGFDVENDGISVGIFGRTINTINGQRSTPLIYIDNVQLLSFDQLQGMQLADVDEFYVNQHAIVPTVNNRMGIIKIYMKKSFSHRSKEISDSSYTIKDGFAKVEPFENATYNSTSDSGFINFGVIDWQPVTLPDSKREFTINVPNTSQKTIRLIIEGIGVDGKMISEIKTIQVQ
jgi:hypothetical protein